MTTLQEHLKKIAPLGGDATYKKHGSKHYKKLSKKGNKAKKRLKIKSN